ncbi:MAG: MFS transporter, partial [Burkholderiaceae bacterium]|nr:MFS transporter [Burkholderiaceae bacterium]
MSLGFLGIQFGFALQNANMGRIFQTLGVDMGQIGILWIAAPLTGLVVQPIIGYMSDRTWGRWGRRRPYFLAGALLASLALIGMPNSSALWIAAGMLWVLDASINVSMEPFRAFVGDLLPKDQVTKGYAFQTFFIGVGAVVASALPYVLTNWFQVANTAPAGVIPDSVVYSFYLGALAFFGAVLWTVIRTKEYSPEEMSKFHPETEEESGAPPSSGISGFFRDYLNMPKVMVQLSMVQFFTWFTWFAMWTYATAAFTQHIYHTSDTSSALYNEGANWWGVCGSVYSGSSALFAFLLPVLASKTSRKAAHAISLAIGGLSFVSIYFIASPDLLILSFLGVGLAWASTLSMPYAILACTIPAKKMGMYMGMFNMSIVIPQAAAALSLGYFLTHFFDGKAVMVLVLGGVSMMIAAALSMWVKEV